MSATCHAKCNLSNLRSQRGAVFIVMLVIMVLGATTILVASLSGHSLRMGREQITAVALARAKEALIGYAASRGDIAGTPRPGDLPCPDTDAPPPPGTVNNNYGAAESTCVAGKIGRLPWKTLGIPELRDESGEPLWYAISGNFRSYNSNSNPLNSDTAGTLDVYDKDGATLLTSASDKAVAVVFAPSHIMSGQSRSSTSTFCTTTGSNLAQNVCATNYLEAGGTTTSRNNATTNGPFVAADESNTFNDRLIYITASQLMQAVEKRVAGEIRKHLEEYFLSWNAYPFAATFSNPSSATYRGTSFRDEGLYPFGGLNGIGSQPTPPAWGADPSISGDIIGGVNCSRTEGDWWNSRARCSAAFGTFTVRPGATVTMTGHLNDVGRGFWKLHDLADTAQFRLRNADDVTVPASSLLDNVAINGSLNYADGSATVSFTGVGKSDGSSIMRRIEFRDIQYQSSPLPSWFAVNNWNEVMYYAASPGYTPNPTRACVPLPGTPSCLTVTGPNGTHNDRHAVIIMTGSALPGHSHPSSSLSNYLEGENQTTGDFTFENQIRSSTFNDQAITVAP